MGATTTGSRWRGPVYGDPAFGTSPIQSGPRVDRKIFPDISVTPSDDYRRTGDGWCTTRTNQEDSKLTWRHSDGRRQVADLAKRRGATRWRRDGKELFYLNENVVMAADVNGAGAAFQVGAVRRLFEVQRRRESYVGFGTGRVYDVTPDGQRFLVDVVAEEQAALPPPIMVITNWTATLR